MAVLSNQARDARAVVTAAVTFIPSPGGTCVDPLAGLLCRSISTERGGFFDADSTRARGPKVGWVAVSQSEWSANRSTPQ